MYTEILRILLRVTSTLRRARNGTNNLPFARQPALPSELVCCFIKGFIHAAAGVLRDCWPRPRPPALTVWDSSWHLSLTSFSMPSSLERCWSSSSRRSWASCFWDSASCRVPFSRSRSVCISWGRGPNRTFEAQTEVLVIVGSRTYTVRLLKSCVARGFHSSSHKQCDRRRKDQGGIYAVVTVRPSSIFSVHTAHCAMTHSDAPSATGAV